MNIEIRRATPDDIPEMYTVSLLAHQRSYAPLVPNVGLSKFDERYTRNEKRMSDFYTKITSRLNDPSWEILVAESDEKNIVGYTLGQIVDDGDTLHKAGLFVHPDFQGNRIGSRLFDASLERATPGMTIFLEVIDKNLSAIRLYESRGFKQIRVAERDYYGATLIRMEKTSQR